MRRPFSVREPRPDTRDMATRRRKKKPNSSGALGYCVSVVDHGEEHAFGGLGMCGAPVTALELGEAGHKHGCAKGHVGGPHVSREELDREVADRRRNVEVSTEAMADMTARFAAIEELPLLDSWCSECAKAGIESQQRESPSGPTCKYGHGGASGVIPSRRGPHASRDVTRADVIDPGFEIREGDRLTIMYHGAKLQIAKYNSVELDGGIYSRSLQPGDDPEEQWDRIHAYLERKALEKARAKLKRMSEELHRARNNVETGTAYDG